MFDQGWSELCRKVGLQNRVGHHCPTHSEGQSPWNGHLGGSRTLVCHCSHLDRTWQREHERQCKSLIIFTWNVTISVTKISVFGTNTTWKSMVLGTNFGTKAKHKNMLIETTLFFINNVKQKLNVQNQCHSLYFSLFSFPQVITIMKKKQTSFTQKILSISVATEKHL